MKVRGADHAFRVVSAGGDKSVPAQAGFLALLRTCHWSARFLGRDRKGSSSDADAHCAIEKTRRARRLAGLSG